MTERGRLVVIEGPDGVGKSTLTMVVQAKLVERGFACDHLSFPGREEGTLGSLVYQLHHDPKRFGVESIPSASLQLLHVAAHLDAITNRILPAIDAGRWIILDRYWWSTWVYGIVDGADRKTLTAMIEVERMAWKGVVPTPAFLIRRTEPLRGSEPIDLWTKLGAAYAELAQAEGGRYPVSVIENDGPIAETVAGILEIIESVRFRLVTKPGRKSRRTERNQRRTIEQERGTPDLFSKVVKEPERNGDPATKDADKRLAPHVFSPLAPATPTEVYETYWRFAAERQAVFFRRIEGAIPLTDDPILAQYKFTNAYRASDRVSQYLIRNVIYQQDQSPEEIFFRVMLFKLFNKIDTWELLAEQFGTPTYSSYDFDRYARVLDEAMKSGQRIYSAAYIMPSGSGEFEDERKHRSHLKLLERMMMDGLAVRIAESRSMKEAFALMRANPMIGDFLAYQYLTDINYSTICDFKETEFVVPGPGARDGIRKCFLSLGGLNEADMIRWITDHQEEEIARFGISFRSLWGRRLQFIDCQNLFCEVGKYARLAHPDVKGIGGRTRIKQSYRRHPDSIQYWYPPKWGINALVEKSQGKARSPA